jgi:23S rRNA (cytidine2498-2'-O)-methyltransferase
MTIFKIIFISMNSIILYCRSGFEKECAAEIMDAAAGAGAHGFVKAEPLTGYVVFTTSVPEGIKVLTAKVRFTHLVFCRQMFAAFDEITGLPVEDRVDFIIKALKPKGISVNEVFVETADTDESKRILPFCRTFSFHFTKALLKNGMMQPDAREAAPAFRLHLFFLRSDRVYAGISEKSNSSPWLMGVPRLKFPHGAPSRSTLKLEEAFHVFLPDAGKADLKPGMEVVDLGASPGGWTYQLVRRGMRVTAIDNGPMDQALLQSGLVHHIRADGFSYSPPRPVEWMVCDIAEQPSRIAKLASQWLARGWCRSSIFNLKLPMKKRYDEVKRCMDIIRTELDRASLRYSLSAKHLYHDREEVTVHVTVVR